MHGTIFIIIIIFRAHFRVKLMESYQEIARRNVFLLWCIVSLRVGAFSIVVVVAVSVCKSPPPFSRREGHCQVLPSSTVFLCQSEERQKAPCLLVMTASKPNLCLLSLAN